MLSYGSRAAQTVCVRCELWQIIAGFRAHRLPLPSQHTCRVFSTTRLRCQDELASPGDKRPSRRGRDRGYVYRHLHPNGRIVGKPGRRQRQSSEQLATNSLGKPSEVIVLRDVEEEQKSSKIPNPPGIGLKLEDRDTLTAVLSAQEIETAVTRRNQTPEQKEVDSSIDGLRPHRNVLERSEFDSLSKTLMESYNTRQLAQYLLRSLSVAANGSNGFKDGHAKRPYMQASQWHAGRTALEERIEPMTFKKGDLGSTKAKLVDQILRLAWHTLIGSEEQPVGELEIRLEPWQINMLFDLTYDNKSTVERFINSPLLMRASDVRPFRPDNIVRITARRQDAEEISRRLQNRLAYVGRLEVDLDVFEPMLGKPGWPVHLGELFQDADVKYISDLTDTVVRKETTNSIAIYGIDERNRLNARRLLLALLDLPSPKDTTYVAPRKPTNSSAAGTALLATASTTQPSLVEYPVTSIHRQHHGKSLFRLTLPRQHRAETDITANLTDKDMRWENGIAHVILNKLEKHKPLHLPPPPTEAAKDVSWFAAESVKSFDWAASFCILLQNDESAPFGASLIEDTDEGRKHTRQATPPLTTLHQVPGLSPLLSYFTPPRAAPELPDQSSPQRVRPLSERPVLVTHFSPSPLGPQGLEAARKWPRISVNCRLGGFHGSTGQPWLRESYVRLKVDEQEVHVPCPDQAADLSFSRYVSLFPGAQTFNEISNFRQFKMDLQSSIGKGGGKLATMPGLHVRLPPSLLPTRRSSKTQAQLKRDGVEYLLERLEQVQHVDLVPIHEHPHMDSEVRQMLAEWPEGMVLRVSEIEAGTFGGQRTEVKLLKKGSKPLPQRGPSAGSPTSVGDTVGFGAEVAGEGDQRTTPLASSEVAPGPPESCSPLVKTSVRLLRLLTRANAGQLALWRPSASPPSFPRSAGASEVQVDESSSS